MKNQNKAEMDDPEEAVCTNLDGGFIIFQVIALALSLVSPFL